MGVPAFLPRACCTAWLHEFAQGLSFWRESAYPVTIRQQDERLRKTHADHCSFSDSNGTARGCPELFFRRISTFRSACSSFVWQKRDSLIPSSNNSSAESSDRSPLSSFLTISSRRFSAVSKSGTSDIRRIVVDVSI